MATGNPSLPVIRAVLLAQTQTHLMGPSDYNRESAPELEARETGQCSHKTQNVIGISILDIFVYQIFLLYQRHNNRMDTSSGVRSCLLAGSAFV